MVPAKLPMEDTFARLPRFAARCSTYRHREVDMKKLLPAVGLALGMALASVGHSAIKSVVLVHGAFADGSGWSLVAAVLEHDGYTVFVVQEPETTFEADVAATRLVTGPLWALRPCRPQLRWNGHHRSRRSSLRQGTGVCSRVQPNVGESAGALNSKTPPASNSITPVGGGFLQVKPESFPEDFAADVPRPLAHFMAISQVPITMEAFGAKSTVVAWSSKPSYAVVAMQDRMINPDLERFMTSRAKSKTIELPGSHAVFLSHPKEVAELMREPRRLPNEVQGILVAAAGKPPEGRAHRANWRATLSGVAPRALYAPLR